MHLNFDNAASYKTQHAALDKLLKVFGDNQREWREFHSLIAVNKLGFYVPLVITQDLDIIGKCVHHDIRVIARTTEEVF